MQQPPIDFARENPKVFLPGGRADLRDFASALITDALVLNVKPVIADVFAEWYIVAAKEDWIAKECKYSVFDSFYRVQLFHEHFQNSNRANLIIAAFTLDVVTFGTDGKTIVKGCNFDLSELESFISEKYSGYRAVAFQGVDPPIVVSS